MVFVCFGTVLGVPSILYMFMYRGAVPATAVGVRRNTVILASHVCESAFPRPPFTSAALHDDIRASKMSCSSSSRLGSSSSRLGELRVPHRACRRSKPSHRSGHRNYSHLRVLRRRV